MQTITMLAGDAFGLPIEISLDDRVATDKDVENVEVFIGNVGKTMSAREVYYDAESGAFIVPLSQDDTYRLRGKNTVQVRVKFANDEVLGEEAGMLVIGGSLSKAVL